MRLPHGAEAIVPREKITDYLLSDSHAEGRDKAVFFKHYGFQSRAWLRLVDALRAHATVHEVAQAEDTAFGTRYAVEGPLETPDGRRPMVRSVWFVDTGLATPRFITAYPLRGSAR